MRQDIEQTVKTVMAEILGMEIGSITENTARDNAVGWDSANHITLVLALEEEFGISLDVPEIESMFSFSDVMQVIESKL